MIASPTPYFLLVTILLVSLPPFLVVAPKLPNPPHRHRLLSRQSASVEDTVCAFYHVGGTNQYSNMECPHPNQYCGIDKATGKIQGCVNADHCPAKGSSGKTIVCDPKAPSCCCRSTRAEYEKGEILCNNILHQKDDRRWKQACGLSELRNLEICQVSPTITVPCREEEMDVDCWPFQVCGIDRVYGDLQGCVSATADCPASLGGRVIVCDPNKPSCCCKGDTSVKEACNNFKSWKFPQIWKQACSLQELAPLDVCLIPPRLPPTTKAPPTLPAKLSTRPINPRVPASPDTPSNRKDHDYADLGEENSKTTTWLTPFSILVSLVVAILLTGLIYHFYFWWKQSDVVNAPYGSLIQIHPQQQHLHSGAATLGTFLA